MSAPASTPTTPDHLVAGEILDLVLSRRRVLYLGRSMVAARDVLEMVDQLGRNRGVLGRVVRASGMESYALVDDDRARARFLSVRSGSLRGQVADVVLVHATGEELPLRQSIRRNLSGSPAQFQDLEVLQACGARVEYR